MVYLDGNLDRGRTTMSDNGEPIPSNQPRKRGRKNASVRPRTKTINNAAKAKKISLEQITEVFDYWKKTMNARLALLDEVRHTIIGAAIHDYGVEICLKAIDGTTLSEWHMGNNPHNKRYNSIDLILRNADNIEKFSELVARRDAIQEFLNE